jgi:hypothetical protein
VWTASQILDWLATDAHDAAALAMPPQPRGTD